MNDRPLVSIVMPFYLTPPEFLREAVESVLNQSYPSIELLLVDDGASGEVAEVARQYQVDQPGRVRLLAHPGNQNRGASASRQMAVEQASGSLIAFLDADDIWLPNKLEEQVPVLMQAPEAGMLYGNTLYWHSWTGDARDQRRDYQPALGVQPNRLYHPPTLLPLYLTGRAAVPCMCSLLVRKDVLLNSGGFESSFHSVYTDQVLYARLVLAAPVYVVNTCGDWYRQFPDSSTGKARQSGRMEDARRQYLTWLSSYLEQTGCQDPSLQHALRREGWLLSSPRWMHRRPRLRRTLRWAKKWMLRARSVVLRN